MLKNSEKGGDEEDKRQFIAIQCFCIWLTVDLSESITTHVYHVTVHDLLPSNKSII